MMDCFRLVRLVNVHVLMCERPIGITNTQSQVIVAVFHSNQPIPKFTWNSSCHKFYFGTKSGIFTVSIVLSSGSHTFTLKGVK